MKIQLIHSDVMDKLDEVQKAIENVKLEDAPVSLLGENYLTYTIEWKEREQNIIRLIDDYMKELEKNVADTKINVTAMKNQDEAISR
ncbi:DUF5344 family protein [Metabacillus litoralis]|uniref:DUF5344 family protein n=1 Tax=Metabacillus litoralis TaxID=152268 RepID=UPI000EF5F264|nr:DUF5344 family protein [Metabacillus litoralis]MCM3164002.1 YwqI/YxiC family protein [Metabacillus litoralis]